MPYRENDAAALRGRLVPRLRSASDPTEGLRQPLLPSERSLEAPWVHLALDDGSPPSEDEVLDELGTPEAAFAAAIANLDPSTVALRTEDGVVVCEGEHAAEMLLSPTFLDRLHDEAGARKLFVLIPERGLLLAADQRLGREALERARDASDRRHASPLTPWVLRMERGRLRGRASAEAPPAPRAGAPRFAAPAREDGEDGEPVERLAPRPRRDPAWMPSSLVGKLALFGGALAALFVAAALRGAMNRPREIRIPDPSVLRSIEASNEAFERGVESVEVTARSDDAGRELTLTSPTTDPDGLMHLVERARREATDPHLHAIHLRPTRAQVGQISEQTLQSLTQVVHDRARAAGRADEIEVTIAVVE